MSLARESLSKQDVITIMDPILKAFRVHAVLDEDDSARGIWRILFEYNNISAMMEISEFPDEEGSYTVLTAIIPDDVTTGRMHRRPVVNDSDAQVSHTEKVYRSQIEMKMFDLISQTFPYAAMNSSANKTLLNLVAALHFRVQHLESSFFY